MCSDSCSPGAGWGRARDYSLATTIIGIPFAWAHLKLAALSLWPISKTIVTTEEAENLQRRTGRA